MQQYAASDKRRVCVASDLDACESGRAGSRAHVMLGACPVPATQGQEPESWSSGCQCLMTVDTQLRPELKVDTDSGHRQWTRQ